MQESAPKDQEYLPKEPLDLPKPYQSLPESTSEQEHESYNDSSPEVRTLLSWHAPGRPFRKRDKSYYINILLILLPLEIIFFLFAQHLLMLVSVALVFLYYALTTVPPHDFRYKISTEGIMIEDYFFLWQELYDFYFKRIENTDSIIVRTKSLLPGELTINLGDIHREQVKSIIIHFLPYREYVKPSTLEKASHWLSKTFPLERTPHASS